LTVSDVDTDAGVVAAGVEASAVSIAETEKLVGPPAAVGVPLHDATALAVPWFVTGQVIPAGNVPADGAVML